MPQTPCAQPLTPCVPRAPICEDDSPATCVVVRLCRFVVFRFPKFVVVNDPSCCVAIRSSACAQCRIAVVQRIHSRVVRPLISVDVIAPKFEVDNPANSVVLSPFTCVVLRFTNVVVLSALMPCVPSDPTCDEVIRQLRRAQVPRFVVFNLQPGRRQCSKLCRCHHRSSTLTARSALSCSDPSPASCSMPANTSCSTH